ncbi:hypothetical protein ABH904_002936 [Pseudomonas frederiksbergensis]
MSEVAEGASVLFRSLHGAFTHMSGHFALAFPRLDHKSPHARLLVFRVFAESLEDLESLHNFMKGGDGLGRRFRADFPETVPVDFYGQWKAYKRARIHARSVPEARAKTMRQLDEAGTSWIDMGSKENGQRFRMYVTVVESNQAGEIGRVNSYGLSIADQLLYLPHIEG